jgi:predicted nucleic acid-binding protein
MNDRFCDTNVLLYLLSNDQRKAAVAERLLRSIPTISVQVLNEFAYAARCKTMRSWPEILNMLSLIVTATDVVPLTYDIHVAGIDLVGLHKFSVYDAMIVAAALEHGCTTLYSEDMQHGQLIAGQLRILDPFL